MNSKIALIGNTCNNNFSIMRYFRTLGTEAHLLLYSNEGLSNSNPIHNPEWDTWEIDKWLPFIHRLPIPHGIQGVVGRPDRLILRPTKQELLDIFKGYDKYIGSGITPSLFERINKSLDIFYPHSLGVEWVGDDGTIELLNKINIQWPFRWYVKKMQLRGISSAKITVNASMDYTKDVLIQNGISFKTKYIPQVYNIEEIPKVVTDDTLNSLVSNLSSSSLTVFAPMRQYWGEKRDSKNTDWLIIGFAKFIKSYPLSNAKLILVDWGDNALNSRALCNDLNIYSNVIWLPLLKRRQILWILSHCCDIAAGQFNTTPGQIWASTGWEALAMGTPLMQSVNFSSLEYQKLFNHELPYILDVKSTEDIYNNLLNIYKNKNLIKKLSFLNRKWFNTHNGIGLANEWLSLLNIKPRFSIRGEFKHEVQL